jgi:HAMP domain-containing protein
MAVFAFLLSRFFEGGGQMTALVWFLGCGLSLALPTLAVAVATRVFRRITTPLSDVMAAAESVAEGDLSVRVPEPGHAPDEFSRLVRSFNRMTEELELSAQQRRNLTSDVAHELRTPLHIIQGNLEGVLDGVYEPSVDHIEATLDETRLLSRLVDDLQTLSLAEAGQLALKLEPVNVAELLSDVGTSFSGQAEAAGIDLQVKTEQGDEPMVIQADVGRLDQVLNNLMSRSVITGKGFHQRIYPMFLTVSGAGTGHGPGWWEAEAAWDWPLPGSWWVLTTVRSRLKANRGKRQFLLSSCPVGDRFNIPPQPPRISSPQMIATGPSFVLVRNSTLDSSPFKRRL